MQTQANIVIIGGGIMGVSLAYHLAQIGCTDVVLLEKRDIASGSTAHAAGLVTQFHPSPSMMKIRKLSIELYQQIHSEVGNVSGWSQVGSLRVASSPTQMKELQRKVSQAKAVGLDVEIINADEALNLSPLMSSSDLEGAVYLPQDGHLEPYSMTTELARRARQAGVSVQTGVCATGIRFTSGGEITQVDTDHGSIKTPNVVIASGMWSPKIGSMVGINLPMNPVRHQYMITLPIPGNELPHQTPVMRDPDRLVYIREEVGGFLVGGFERNPKAVPLEEVTWDFGATPFPADWERFDELMEGAVQRIPLLEKAEVVDLINYPDALTPDGNPCVGPVPGFQGLYVAAGMSLNGFGGGGGMGKLLAEWIVEGQPRIDMHEYNVRRFGPIYDRSEYLLTRAREVYKYYYFLRYPNDEYEWGRPQRVSPVYQRTQEYGGVFGEKNGWERVNYYQPDQPWRFAGADQRTWGWGRPIYFDRVASEHKTARERIALIDMSSFGKIDVRGPGALPLLQQLSVSDVDKPMGSVVYTQFLNARGGIESDLTITRLGEQHFRVVTGSAFIYNDLGWIRMHTPNGNSVEVKDVSEEWACLSLWGPSARHVLGKVTPDEIGNDSFPYLTAKNIMVHDLNVLAVRVSYIGELGWELNTKPQNASRLWDILMDAGEEEGIGPIGYKAVDSLRLEKGYRYWSVDLTPEENPFEAGLGFCVNLDKDYFIGQDALRGSKELGIQRKLRTLTIDADPWAVFGGEAVHNNGTVISRLRSAGYGYTVKETIGFAYLPLPMGEIGNELEIEVFGERVRAKVSRDTLYDPKGEKLRL